MTFDQIVTTFDAKPSGARHMAMCPAHSGQRAALSLSERDGKLLVHCHAGCTTEAVLGAKDLTMQDLFVDGNSYSSNGHNADGHNTNGHKAKSPVGKPPWHPDRFDCVYTYRDETGIPLYENVRVKDPKDFRARRDAKQRPWSVEGIRRVLYRLNELKGQTAVHVAEGEKDCDRLWDAGFVATTNVFGAGSWSDDYTKQLQEAGCEHVVMLPDNDDPGRKHAETVAASCHAAGISVQVVALPDLLIGGDVSDYLNAHSADEFLQIVMDAPLWAPSTNAPLLDVPVVEVVPAPAPYTFVHAFPPDHFVTAWIKRFSQQCDAALEYHEAAALVALAQATPTLSARISGSADGLRTNLYILFLGLAGITRKSTAKDYAVEVLRRALPQVLLPEQMTQESFVESLTQCNGGSALWAIDEFTDTLSKMLNATFLAGMRGVLLEMYSRTSYSYRRVSKTVKAKKKGNEDSAVERAEDMFHIDNVAFSLIGCATDTLFRSLDSTAVGSGLLTRFAIIMPEGKPARLPQFALTEDAIPSALVQWIHGISERTAKQSVVFEPDVLQRIDEAIDKPLDESGDRCQMTVRMGVMARKVAMLAAAGRPLQDGALETPHLVVTMDDAEAAIKVVTRWIGYARAFEARTDESAFEVTVQKCVAIIKGQTLNRRVIAQRVHVPARELLEIEKTLQQREQIEVMTYQPATGRPSTSWRWVA